METEINRNNSDTTWEYSTSSLFVMLKNAMHLVSYLTASNLRCLIIFLALRSRNTGSE